MYSCKVFGRYLITTNTREISKTIFPWFIFLKVYLSVSKFSNRMITPGLNNGRSETGDFNISTHLNVIWATKMYGQSSKVTLPCTAFDTNAKLSAFI